jgi:hypothetical protein
MSAKFQHWWNTWEPKPPIRRMHGLLTDRHAITLAIGDGYLEIHKKLFWRKPNPDAIIESEIAAFLEHTL